jgi:uncharacterized OsmC-like protein
LNSEATGEVELEGKVLVIRRIHVRYQLKCDPAHRETATRVFGFHADACPIALTLRGCIGITTELALADA